MKNREKEGRKWWLPLSTVICHKVNLHCQQSKARAEYPD